MDWFQGIKVAKDPDATLTWRWDWSEWLGAGDTISAKAVTAEDGITLGTVSHGDDYVDVTLSGGAAGQTYGVTVEVTTAAGLIDQRTVRFEVAER